MIALWTTIAAMALLALAEWLHIRRSQRVARLAFGPGGTPREWTRFVPWLRVFCVGAVVWGFVTLFQLGPLAVRSDTSIPEGGYRHLLLALDVSPSMQLQDGGPAGQLTRAQRASEVMSSVLHRIATDQVRISIVAFYTGAKPVVVDTYDLEVVKNCLNDLPLAIAFEVGQTELLEGVRQCAELAKPWQPDSTTLIVVTDGDTIPDAGMPQLPRSIQQTLIVGVGNVRAGHFIDGHQSRQDASTLRQLAARLRGEYFDANQKHLPSGLMSDLSMTLPLRDIRERGRREAALVCIGTGSFTLAAIPVALALAGSSWQSRYRSQRKPAQPESCPKEAESTHEPEKLTYA